MALLLSGSTAFAKAQAPAATAPSGSQIYETLPTVDPAAARSSYRIVPNDTLNLQVFDEPTLSNDELQVDANGNIQMPLIGEVSAAGRTPGDVANEIEKRLKQRYIVDPQVVLSVKKAAPRMVSVEGQVNKPGVYEIDGNTTLLSALAKAESPTRVARLSDIMVFRNVDGKRMGARFNLTDIRKGNAPDPAVLSGDVIVVGYSPGKGAWRDIVATAPLLNLFYVFR